MKKQISALLVATMMVTCMSMGANALATYKTDEQPVVSTVKVATENYLTKWFANKLSEYYDLSNYHFTFSTVSCKNGQLDAYGYLEVKHHLKYQTLDELPFVQGAKDALNIDSMEAVVDGDFREMASATAMPMALSVDTKLSATQIDYMGTALKEQFSSIENDMGDFTATYFFHIVGGFDGTSITVPVVTLENEGDGYVSADVVLPKSTTELYQEGKDSITQLAAAVASADINDIVPAKSRTYASYNRLAARDYALKYSGNPVQSCKDGKLKYNSKVKFPDGVDYSKWNTSEYQYFSDFCHDDCADFVSQAMSKGGLPEDGTWYRTKNASTKSYGKEWISVSKMTNYMCKKGYWTPSTFAACNAGNIRVKAGHVTMITLNNTLTHCFSAHTNDRNNAAFGEDSDYSYYAINLN